MLISKLKDWIESQGLRKSKVAEMLGITPIHLSYILGGSRNPSIDLEERIRALIDTEAVFKKA